MSRLLFDIETDGLLDQLTKVHSLVIKDVDTGEVMSCYPEGHPDGSKHAIPAGVQCLMEADTIIGHNIIKFDIPALQKVYPWFTFEGRVLDTLVLARLMWPEIGGPDERLVKAGTMPKKHRGRYSLESFGYRVGLWKGDYSDIMKAKGLDPWAEWNQDMQDYCEQDVEVNFALWQRCVAKWTDARLPADQRVPYSDEAVDLEMQVATILARQEARGVAFDVEKAQALYAELVGKRAALDDKLRETFGSWNAPDGVVTVKKTREVKRADLGEITLRRFSDKTGKELKPYVGPIKELYAEGAVYSKVRVIEFNPSSTQHIENRLRKLFGWQPEEFTPSGQAKLDDAVISQLPYPEAKLLGEYLTVQKRIGQLAEGKQALIRKEKNGRIHGSVITAGAVTRRMTHNNPNLAQVPKVKKDKAGRVRLGFDGGYGHEFRALFTTTAGYLLVGCDADALELRCLAGYMARFDGGAYIETVLKGNKEDGSDMHSTNCRALGMDPKGLYPVDGKEMSGRDIAKVWFYAFIYGAGDAKLGKILGRRDMKKAGKESRENFLRNLPALGKLVEGVKMRANSRGFLVGLDGGKLQVRSPHSALNTLLQSAGAIIMKQAQVILDADLRAAGLSPGRDYEFVLTIHDEWQLEALPNVADIVGSKAEEAIKKAGEQLNFACPLAGNADVGNNWSATH